MGRFKRMVEKCLVMHQKLLDTPKYPLKRGTLTVVPPLKRGVRGDRTRKINYFCAIFLPIPYLKLSVMPLIQ